MCNDATFFKIGRIGKFEYTKNVAWLFHDFFNRDKPSRTLIFFSRF